MEETRQGDVWKGVDFWTQEIEKAGLKDKLLPFNDVLTGNEAPSGNVEPMLRDVALDGRKVGIYHWDYPKKDTSSHRIYIHKK